MGYPLSSVATSGPDAPPLPANSGSGKRVVYDRAGQRVWAVDKNGQRHPLVARLGQQVQQRDARHPRGVQPLRGVDGVERQGVPAADDPLAEDRHRRHRLPRHPDRTSPTARAYQTDAELGTRLSGGCQRQANLDADFMWDFAQIGTKVVVL